MTWEEVTVSCMKGVWHKIWHSDENYSTSFDNLYMPIKEVAKLHKKVVLTMLIPWASMKF